MNLKKTLLALFRFFLLLCLPFCAMSQSVEYSVKASMLYKIAQYTDWTTNTGSDYFRIAVLGKSPFHGELERLAAKIKIKNKPVMISYISQLKDGAGTQVIFVSQSESKHIQEILNVYQSMNILIVTDSPDFTGQGVHFNFFKENDETIHFEIDLKSMKVSGLKPDLQLISIGKIVNKL